MREGQILSRQRLGCQVGKAFGRGSLFGRRGPSFEERTKPGGQTHDVFPAQNAIAQVAAPWIRQPLGFRIDVEKDLAEPVELTELGSGAVEHDPVGPDKVYQAGLGAIFEAENMHYTLNYYVHLAGREKNTQLQLRMAKDAAEQPSEVPIVISAREGRRGCLAKNGMSLRAERARQFQFIKRRANGLKPGDIDNLDQKLA